ncbi:MAG TPA: hypothetical protein GXZ50_07540 [Clostridia bacterium]|nr:hypothetical protein [Clostridia bacterium]
MMGYRYGMMGYGWGWLMMICLIVLTILAVIVLIRYLQFSGKENYRAVENNALNILNERYARGEITE